MIRNSETIDESSLFPERGSVEPPTGAAVLAALEELGIVGMWADGTDIEDSGEFARKLRERSQERTSE